MGAGTSSCGRAKVVLLQVSLKVAVGDRERDAAVVNGAVEEVDPPRTHSRHLFKMTNNMIHHRQVVFGQAGRFFNYNLSGGVRNPEARSENPLEHEMLHVFSSIFNYIYSCVVLG